MATAVGPGPSSEQMFAEKAAWAAKMRQQFSPEGMCNDDGTINQDFFKPKKIIIQLTEDKKWGQAEKEALYKVSSITEFFTARLSIQSVSSNSILLSTATVSSSLFLIIPITGS
jgi:hypothetical protein